MRFVIFTVFTIAWSFMWWYVYTCHIKVCCGASETVVMEEAVSDTEFSGVVRFDVNGGTAQLGVRFPTFRDSLIALLSGTNKLVVTGYSVSNENPEVGQERAVNFLNELVPKLDSSRYSLSARVVERLPNDQPGVSGVDARVITPESSVRKLEDRVLIFFPFNSTARIEDPEIDTYLLELGAYLSEHSDSVAIVGHSDAFGPTNENYQLGLWRAEAIRDLLIANGVSAERIGTESQGELEPIGDNRIKEGARLNRRVEVRLINSE